MLRQPGSHERGYSRATSELYQKFTKTLPDFTECHFSDLPFRDVLEAFAAGDMARGGAEAVVLDGELVWLAPLAESRFGRH